LYRDYSNSESESESLMEIPLKFCNFHPGTFANLKKGEIPEHSRKNMSQYLYPDIAAQLFWRKA